MTVAGYSSMSFSFQAEDGIRDLTVTGVQTCALPILRSSQYGGAAYEIDFQLLPDGARRFGDATGKHIKDHLAIVLNNEVKSAPVINGQISEIGRASCRERV